MSVLLVAFNLSCALFIATAVPDRARRPKTLRNSLTQMNISFEERSDRRPASTDDAFKLESSLAVYPISHDQAQRRHRFPPLATRCRPGRGPLGEVAGATVSGTG